MENIINRILANYKQLKDRGFHYIFLSNIISSILVFILSIIIVRFLSKDLMGAYTYARNIYSIAMIFNGLGISSGIVHFCSSESELKSNSYFLVGIRVGIGFNMIISVVLLFIGLFVKMPLPSANYLVILFSFLPVLVILFQSELSFLRSGYYNREYSIYLILEKSLYFILGSIGVIFLSIKGLFIGRYVAFIIILLIITLNVRRNIKMKNSSPLESNELKVFLKYSVITVVSTGISSILYMIDIFLIGLIIKDSAILADYKTATIIPFSLNILPNSVMIFALPYFSKHLKNIKWLNINYRKMIFCLMCVNGAVTLLMLIFSRQIIYYVFGEQYLTALIPFRILSIGYFITASFRIPAGNFIAAIRKVKVNLINAIIVSILNIILDIILIIKYGSIGAAISTVSIFALSSLIANGYIVKIIRNKR